MKNNLGKILLIAVPILAALVLLYPTYRSSQLESKEKEALLRASHAKTPADSLQIMEQFYKTDGEDLKSAKAGRLKLGLDLRGGMYVTMEVDVVKLIEETAQKETIDETFLDVIAKTKAEASTSEENAMDIFLKHFNSIARPKGKSLLNYFDPGDYKNATEEKIIEILNNNILQAIDQAQEVIRQRIDQYGVSEPNIQKQGSRRIVLELPGVTKQEEMRSLLQTTARLEFKLVRNNQDIAKAFAKIDKVLSQQIKRGRGIAVEDDVLAQDTSATVKDTVLAADVKTGAKKTEKEAKGKTEVKTDSAAKTGDSTVKDAKSNPKDPYAGLSPEEAQKRFHSDHPFTSLFTTLYLPGKNQNAVPMYYINDQIPEGQYMFRILKDSIAKFQLILSRPEIAPLIPLELEVAINAKPERQAVKQQNIEIFDFYALKRESELTGEVVTDARATFDPTTNAPIVTMAMNAEGAESWARITGANVGKQIAIVLDGRVYSAPNVINKITGGNSSITGMANAEESHLLEIVLKAGALKAPVQIIEERVVGPSLGEDSIKSGLTASLFAVIFVVFFMVLYYMKGGIVADISVIMNVMIVLAILAALGGTLTLPGIAGIILTIGMAVDANILVYERIREELYKGRKLKAAIDEGFSKALSAILDSNITTFLTGIILYYLGSGPIQGFALTLMVGILATLFTQIVVSRAIINLMLSSNPDYFNFGQPKNIIAK